MDIFAYTVSIVYASCNNTTLKKCPQCLQLVVIKGFVTVPHWAGIFFLLLKPMHTYIFFSVESTYIDTETLLTCTGTFFIMFIHTKKRKYNADTSLQERRQRRTWLFGDRKENRVSASSGIAKRGVKEYWTIYMRKNRKLRIGVYECVTLRGRQI
jgi:hypothetical protein